VEAKEEWEPLDLVQPTTFTSSQSVLSVLEPRCMTEDQHVPSVKEREVWVHLDPVKFPPEMFISSLNVQHAMEDATCRLELKLSCAVPVKEKEEWVHLDHVKLKMFTSNPTAPTAVADVSPSLPLLLPLLLLLFPALLTVSPRLVHTHQHQLVAVDRADGGGAASAMGSGILV